jgi:hypothetical protein
LRAARLLDSSRANPERSAIVLILPPAQNAVPAPVSTTACTLGSLLTASAARAISSHASREPIALRSLGALSVNVTTLSVRS